MILARIQFRLNSMLDPSVAKIKPSPSHGIDLIDSYSIKILGPFLEDSVIEIVNLSISSGSFATDWKTHLVLPLFKAND